MFVLIQKHSYLEMKVDGDFPVADNVITLRFFGER